MEAFLQCLRQRRVGVHVAGQLGDREVPLLSQRELGQQLGHVVADQMAAEQLAVLAVRDQLDESAGVAEAVCLGVAVNGNLATLTS